MDKELEEIFLNNFEEKIISKESVSGGWLTDKIRIISKSYDIIIKTIELKKINRLNINIEKASEILKQANKYGIKCPKIYSVNGNLVNYDKCNKPIVFIEYFKDTFSKTYKDITPIDMYNIAYEVGKMNKYMNTIKIENKLDNAKLLSKMQSDYDYRINIGRREMNEKYLNDVYKQNDIIDSLKIDFFNDLQIGYCHSDLAQDNLLFDIKGFKAIIDFEITNVSYILRDPARIFLTFCLNENGEINRLLLKVLINGYNKHLKLTLNDIVKGVKILWCLEVNSWIKEAYYVDEVPKKVRKFINEMNWITNNWFDLEKLITY